jgi:predicted DNA-binding transcriptional regulator AlpA
MFEISAAPRELKGNNDKGDYHFLVQKVKVHGVDFDGDPTTGKFEISFKPGESVYQPGYYLPHPERAIYVGRGQNNKPRPMIGGSPSMISLEDMIAWCQERLEELAEAPRKAAYAAYRWFMLRAITHHLTTPPTPRLLSAPLAAAYLGVSERTFDYLWRRAGFPKPHRMGRRLLWDIKLLDAYVDEVSKISSPPPEDDRW